MELAKHGLDSPLCVHELKAFCPDDLLTVAAWCGLFLTLPMIPLIPAVKGIISQP